MDDYVGTYTTSNEQSLTFVKESSQSLKINGGGLPQVPIYPASVNSFFPLDFDVRFIFIRDENGKITRFEAKQEGKIILTGAKN